MIPYRCNYTMRVTSGPAAGSWVGLAVLLAPVRCPGSSGARDEWRLPARRDEFNVGGGLWRAGAFIHRP